MSMINIEELNRINVDRDKAKIEIYDKVLKKCHEKIKKTAKLPGKNTNCFYVVPTYIYGVPRNQIENCIVYIVQSLIKNGFQVYYTHPNLIYISWFNRSNSIEYKKDKKENVVKENFKKIESYKPSGDFLYDISSLDLLKKKNREISD